jgi:hypothetical protein
MALFMCLICRRAQFLFWVLQLIFNFLIAIFLLLPLEKICCQGHILKTYCCYGAQWMRTAQSEKSARLGTSLPGNETASLWNIMLLYKIRWWTVSQKRKLCELTPVMLSSLFWISWLLKMGLIGRPETSVRNYHSTLHNIPEEWRTHMMIWWCRPWFGSAWSDLARCSSAFHTWI